jgi:hypothetical protein
VFDLAFVSDWGDLKRGDLAPPSQLHT